MNNKGSVSVDGLFRALADPTRLRLLNLIADREICVCYFVQILGLSQPKISRHLAYLRKAGIVAARRQGKWMHYRLALSKDSAARAILLVTLKHLSAQKGMQRDVRRLGSACCTPERYVLLEDAPQPKTIRHTTQLPAARRQPAVEFS
jgi:ArsR family transcriptional regulator